MSVICCLISLGITYYNLPKCKLILKEEIVSLEVKRAMIKLGHNYHYRMLRDGTLQVDKGDGKWLRLRYERGK